MTPPDGALFLPNAWSRLSRNEKKTSTEYPTRKATANGGIEAPSVIVKLLNKPTTAPPMPAIRKRAEWAIDGMNVLAFHASQRAQE